MDMTPETTIVELKSVLENDVPEFRMVKRAVVVEELLKAFGDCCWTHRRKLGMPSDSQAQAT